MQIWEKYAHFKARVMYSVMHPRGHRQLGEVEWWPGIVEKNVGIIFFFGGGGGGFLYDRSYSEFRIGNDPVVDTYRDKNHRSSRL